MCLEDAENEGHGPVNGKHGINVQAVHQDKEEKEEKEHIISKDSKDVLPTEMLKNLKVNPSNGDSDIASENASRAGQEDRDIQLASDSEMMEMVLDKGAVSVDSSRPSQPTSETVYTLEEVSNHCGPDSCWIILWDHIYDVTGFIKEHPGGEDIIYEHGGHDATFAFRDVGHSNDALLQMTQYRIGVLVEHERIFKRKKVESCST